MLRRVTTLAALEPSAEGADAAEQESSIRHLLGIPFTPADRGRRRRSSACAAIVGLSWKFDPPTTDRQEDGPDPLPLNTNH